MLISFAAYLSILENYSSMSMWLNDSETSTIISHVLRTYHEEKHIMAINQFSQKWTIGTQASDDDSKAIYFVYS